jgi:hypothetical protein
MDLPYIIKIGADLKPLIYARNSEMDVIIDALLKMELFLTKHSMQTIILKLLRKVLVS